MEYKKTDISFRKANDNDLESVYQLIVNAIAEMEKNNIFQWDERYPDIEILSEDISKQELTLGISENEIASIYVINSEHNEEYKDGSWQYPNASFLVIHRLCVNPKFQNRGVGALTMAHIEAEIKERGVETIRLDAFTQNPYALRMYEKMGYKNVGYMDIRKGVFCLMEKKL